MIVQTHYEPFEGRLKPSRLFFTQKIAKLEARERLVVLEVNKSHIGSSREIPARKEYLWNIEIRINP